MGDDEIIINFEDTEENILYGLDAWTQYLSVRDLPARASSLKRLQKLIQSDRSTIQQLEEVVRKDPVLTLYVVKGAQLKHNDNDSAIKSILHAVTLLGYDGIEDIANNIKPISLNPTNVQQKRFLHSIACSHHAASQLQEWMHLKHLPLIDESFLAALFYSVGFWSLWLHAPLHMQKIQMRIHEQNESPIAAEQEILGCSMQMISQSLAKTWQLSELTQLAQDHSTSPSYETLKKLHKRALKDPTLSAQEVRELNHITQQKYFPIKLANWIALNANRGWYTSQTMRNMDLVSDYLGLSLEQTSALVHKACAQSSRDYFAPGIMSPACQLLFNHSEIKIHYKMGIKEFTANQSKFPIPEVPMIKPFELQDFDREYTNKEFYFIIEQYLKADKESTKFQKAPQILLALLQGLERGLGVKRLALFSISKKNNSLKTVQSTGFDDEHPINKFQTLLADPDILHSLSSKQTYVVFDSLTEKKLTPRISRLFREVCAREYMLISIFKVNQPVAALYIDMNNKAITNFTRERVRHLAYVAAQSLENF